MVVYRIDNASRQKNALTGIGAELYGGRWNAIGEKAVYCAEHRSLAMLEILAHAGQQALFPVNRVMFKIELPVDHLDEIRVSSLPKAWNDLASYHSTDNLFGKHCLSKNKLGLKVPSVIVPDEFNVILNPMHEYFKQIKVLDKKLIKWDGRLLI